MKVAGERKLVLIGLDNSGKTSIVLSLKGDRNLLSYYSLKPTPGKRIEDILSNGTLFHVWELGGQRIYINKYLADFDQYTHNVDTLIFVIDVQDPGRYGGALEYFEAIVGKFRGCKSFPKISLFLHKFDPILEEVTEERYSDAVLYAKIVREVAKIVTSDFVLDVFKTTIYTIFRKTPFSAVLPQS